MEKKQITVANQYDARKQTPYYQTYRNHEPTQFPVIHDRVKQHKGGHEVLAYVLQEFSSLGIAAYGTHNEIVDVDT